MGFPAAMQETWVPSLGWEDPLEEGMATHPSILAWRIPHGQRTLADYNAWGHKELDMTEQLSLLLDHRKNKIISEKHLLLLQ